jgi:hypothetical protein
MGCKTCGFFAIVTAYALRPAASAAERAGYVLSGAAAVSVSPIPSPREATRRGHVELNPTKADF